MITTPSVALLLRAVRQQIEERIIPVVNEPATVVELQMMLSVLDMIAVRADTEVAWMLEEIQDIESSLAAHSAVGDLSDQAGEALSALRRHDRLSFTIPDVRRHYDLAGEALSCAAEHGFASGQASLQATVWRLLQARLDNELVTVGVFKAVGRTEASVA